MKKLLVLGLVLMSTVSLFATSYLLSSTKGAQGIEYISTNNNTIEVEVNRVITTSNYTYRVKGAYYKVTGASAASSSNALFLAIGSGSSTTSSYTAIYDVVIPMDPIGAAITDGLAATQNYGLDYTNVWYEQGMVGNTDYRGDTLNIQVRANSKSTMVATLDVLDQIYIKIEKVLFGN